jgi:hypothetical protein
LTPWAAPAASFIKRPISSKNRLLVWVILKRSGRCKLIVTDMTMAIPKERFKSAVGGQPDAPLPCHAPVSLQSYQALNQKPESQSKKKRP